MKAIEVGRAMVNARLTPMKAEVTDVLVKLFLLSRAKMAVPGILKQEAVYQLVEKRLAFHNVQADEYTIAFVCCLVDRPGTAVLYCAAIHYIEQESKKPVTLESFAEFFGEGFPTIEELERIWRSQKNYGSAPDNWLDYPDMWKVEENTDAV